VARVTSFQSLHLNIDRHAQVDMMRIIVLAEHLHLVLKLARNRGWQAGASQVAM
jgi:hypothetical protein